MGYLLPILCLSLLTTTLPSSATYANKSNFSFIENKGQITDQYGKHRTDIDFKTSGNGSSLFIGSGHMHYQWYKNEYNGEEVTSVSTYRLDVTLENANPNAELILGNKSPYYQTHYTQYVQNAVAHAYEKITYKNIYPGIDWVLKTGTEGIKYDFVVHEGADYSQIKIRYKGADKIYADNGAIQIETPFGNVVEGAPYTYIQNTDHEVPSRYNLEGDVLSFHLDDQNDNVIIDPSIEWATYIGDTVEDYIYTIVTDNNDNIYVAGFTNSNNIATTGAQQSSIGSVGIYDGMVQSYTPAGGLRWSTYYGGNKGDLFFSIACNSKNELILAGSTDSSLNLSYSPSGYTVHQPTYGGGENDCFILKLDSNGNRIWCSYYGGSKNDREGGNVPYQAAVAVDDNDNIYLVGTSQSDTGIASSGSYQSSRSSSNVANYEGFIAKFNDSCQRIWGTYYGGTSNKDNFRTVTISNNRIYVGGTFESSGMSSNSTSNSGNYDGLVASFDINTGNRVWATYFGGTGAENVMGIAVRDSNVYLSGSTQSSGIASTGAHQTQLNIGQSTGANDAFLAKFDTTGQKDWSTYFGGDAVDHGANIIVDGAGNIVFAGTSASTSNIATTDGHRTSKNNSDFDAFLTIFTPAGNQVYGTYYGNSSNNTPDYGYAVAKGSDGVLYLAGQTSSSTEIANSGNQISYSGNTDGFLARFTPDTTVFIFQPFTYTNLCAEDTFSMKYGVTANFANNNTFTAQLSNSSGSFANPTTIGSVNDDSSGYIFCTIPSGISGSGFRIRIIASNPLDTSFDNGTNITIKPMPVKPIAGNNGPVCSNNTLQLTSTNSSTGASYIWTGPSNYFATQQNAQRTGLLTSHSGNYIVTATLNGCSRKDTTTVTILQAPNKPVTANNGPLCTGDTLLLTASNLSSGTNLSWSGPNSYSSNQANPPGLQPVTLSNAGNYILSSSLSNGCISKDTTNVIINQSPTSVIAGANTPLCSGDTLYFSSSSAPSGVSYSWVGPASFSSTSASPSIPGAQTNNSGNYILTGSLGNCTLKDTIAVIVNQSPTKPQATSNGPLCSGEDLYLSAGSVSSGSTLLWSGPGSYSSSNANDTINNIAVNQAGDYLITSTMNGCTESDTVSVSVTQSITANISINVNPGTLVCPTTDLKFSVMPSQPNGTKYIWSGPNGWSDTLVSPTVPNISYADSGYYYVKTFTGQCTKGDTNIFIRVTDTIQPPTITANNPVCEEDTIFLTYAPPAGLRYITIFYPDGRQDRDTTLSPIIERIDNANNTHAGDYVVKVESGGCTAYDTLNLVVKAKPNKPTVSNNTPVCEGEDIQLNSTGSNTNITYEWEGPSGYTSTTQNPLINNASPTTGSGYYYSKVIMDGCASDEDSTLVVVNEKPVPDISSNAPVCEGSEMKLHVVDNGNENYSWSKLQGNFSASGDTAKINIVKLTDKGTYIVTALDNNTGCIGYDSVSFNPIALPGKVTFDGDIPVCEKYTLRIATSDTSTNVGYQWTGPGGFSLAAKDLTREDMMYADSGFYYLTASRGKCSITDSINVSIKPTPDTPILKSNSPIAAGEVLAIEITNPDPNALFEWKGPLNFASFSQNISISNVKQLNEGYYLATTTVNGCSSWAEIFIDVTDEQGPKGTLTLYPNPNDGDFTISGELSREQEMPYEIVNSIGMVVYRGKAETDVNLMVDEKINIENYLASGVYFIRILVEGELLELPFTISR